MGSAKKQRRQLRNLGMTSPYDAKIQARKEQANRMEAQRQAREEAERLEREADPDAYERKIAEERRRGRRALEGLAGIMGMVLGGLPSIEAATPRSRSRYH